LEIEPGTSSLASSQEQLLQRAEVDDQHGELVEELKAHLAKVGK
jgi:hypothetical protein